MNLRSRWIARRHSTIDCALGNALPDSARLIITHDTEIAATADRVIVLEKGRVVEAGTPQALRDQAGVFAELERLQTGDLA